MGVPGSAPENERSASGIEVSPSFWKRCWKDVEGRASVLIGDIVLFLIALCGLIVVSVVLRCFGFFIDYNVTYLRIVEGVHFWIYFAVLIAFWLDMLWKISTMLFVRNKG
jgi:hypothetical protein